MFANLIGGWFAIATHRVYWVTAVLLGAVWVLNLIVPILKYPELSWWIGVISGGMIAASVITLIVVFVVISLDDKVLP